MLAVSDDVPLLDDLMPWSVAPLRLGRDWVVAPDERSLRSRWDLLVRSEGAERERLFGPSRARTLRSAVAALPGRTAGTGPFAQEQGPCPAPVRFRYGPFDEQWLIPDQRLIDAARPELWRVADEQQLFAVEQGYVPKDDGPALTVSAALPDGRSPPGARAASARCTAARAASNRTSRRACSLSSPRGTGPGSCPKTCPPGPWRPPARVLRAARCRCPGIPNSGPPASSWGAG